MTGSRFELGYLDSEMETLILQGKIREEEASGAGIRQTHTRLFVYTPRRTNFPSFFQQHGKGEFS